MTLAVILGLWVSMAGAVSPAATPLWPQVAHSLGNGQDQGSQEPSSPAGVQGAPQQPTSPPPEQTPATQSPDSAGQKTEPSASSPAVTKVKKHHHKKKPPVADPPQKIVIRNGGTADPTADLSPGLSKGQAANQRQNANQLLTATESNLQQLSGRNLSTSQQDTVKQIRTYLDQARRAVEAGDLERGHNLAFKAHLLSDDLVKH